MGQHRPRGNGQYFPGRNIDGAGIGQRTALVGAVDVDIERAANVIVDGTNERARAAVVARSQQQRAAGVVVQRPARHVQRHAIAVGSVGQRDRAGVIQRARHIQLCWLAVVVAARQRQVAAAVDGRGARHRHEVLAVRHANQPA